MRSRWLSWAVIGVILVGGLMVLGLMERHLARLSRERREASAGPRATKPWPGTRPRASGPSGPTGASGVPDGAIW